MNKKDWQNTDATYNNLIYKDDYTCIKGKQHNFEARYDYGAPLLTNLESKGCSSSEIADIMNASKAATYIHDICTKCGKIINRENIRNLT